MEVGDGRAASWRDLDEFDDDTPPRHRRWGTWHPDDEANPDVDLENADPSDVHRDDLPGPDL
ncbi:hypothetical protein [Streptomyces sp. NPDC093248]|uniref:hypothetical protein n=1 Tax=Streptomyces sp. NPDC093248 TaxID=3155072 RepID=UPI0034398347